jgi:O-succinylbenzoic acid--CoA ligase
MTLEEFLDEWNNASDKVLVHTSGSTGKPKPMWVEKRRMEASARITCDFLGLKAGDTALLCMSLDYIAGKMVVVRSIVRNLKLINVKPSGHPLKSVDGEITFAAMVPMQVFNSLQVPEEREKLRAIKHLIIGGGAIDDALAAELRTFPNAVWSTYGMTETLSHIALRCMNGDEASDWYTPFDTVSVSLNEDGCLVIDAPLVCETRLTTNDIAEIAGDGSRFRIIGRKDNVIDSGGIKIQIEEVERALKPYIHVPYAISRRADKKFGEIVVLLVKSPDVSEAETICKRVLPKYWQPRLYVSVDEIPMTETGKIKRKVKG